MSLAAPVRGGAEVDKRGPERFHGAQLRERAVEQRAALPRRNQRIVEQLQDEWRRAGRVRRVSTRARDHAARKRDHAHPVERALPVRTQQDATRLAAARERRQLPALVFAQDRRKVEQGRRLADGFHHPLLALHASRHAEQSRDEP